MTKIEIFIKDYAENEIQTAAHLVGFSSTYLFNMINYPDKFPMTKRMAEAIDRVTGGEMDKKSLLWSD